MNHPLRIVLCCQQDLRPQPLPLPAYRFWRDYFQSALTEAGHVVLECPDCAWAEGLLPLDAPARSRWRDETWTRFTRWVAQVHSDRRVDLVLCYLFPDQVEAAAVRQISASGIPVVNFFCDNVREFRRVPAAFRPFDLHWVPERNAAPLYAAAGLPHILLPMPCWVPPNQRQPVHAASLPVTFVGTRDEQREALFAEVLERGLAVDLRGTGWLPAPDAERLEPSARRARDPIELLRRQLSFVERNGVMGWWRKVTHRRPQRLVDFATHARPAPMGDEYWHVLRESVVCLGVNRYPSFRFPFQDPDRYSRLRDIEAPMAGACYLTENAPGVSDLYDVGREIEVYHDAGELVEKARALTADPARQRQLRTEGQRRALADHSIVRSIKRILERVGTIAPVLSSTVPPR